MIRIVTQFVANRHLLVLCDNASCSQFAKAELGNGDTEAEAGQVLNEMVAAGWTVSLMGQVCPGHTKQIVEKANKVQLVSSLVGVVRH